MMPEEKERNRKMNTSRKYFIERCLMMLTGIIFIGISVGCFRLSAFGTDAYTCMNLGISLYLNMNFGTWQLIMNAVILVVVFFQGRQYIGIGTVFNMVCVGYEADFICWFVQDVLAFKMSLAFRIGVLLVGCVFAALGVALYMVTDMGISPYDSVALIVEKRTKGRIAFQKARVISDVAVVVIGTGFCFVSGNEIWLVVGIATLCNAIFNGPLIAFFRRFVSEPIIEKIEK